MGAGRVVSEAEIAEGLRSLGLTSASSVLVHASLRSFGEVEGGAEAVCRALVETCGTVMMVAGTWDHTGLPAPPGLVRPDNAYYNADTWADFDDALAAAVPFSSDLPVDRWLGTIAETLRLGYAHERGTHPLFAFLAVGGHARRLIDAQRVDWPLGPIEALAELRGHVLLLGVDHTSNTTIHLAEQHLGRSRFHRYAKSGAGSWMELPNVSGESHKFDEIEPDLRPFTTEVVIGECRARLIAVEDVLTCTTTLITKDPAALLCTEQGCRCTAALAQYVHSSRR
ncbi:aminoglycoside 3-N-acetyltransferase [Kribbella amoyensis]|uniref:Aminoglycoside N(3)-acetyltransferase n=1 Tax=Kribbella amoyensis TaxID=996641 RepID=A0A561BZ50_9ACTN|nr:AAC(3) family N-acetyltransferase [Kribbella amoyensis]TWD84087.1 aminoglycoside 3-N-acetyltransferase [Kribbella amoyensis]